MKKTVYIPARPDHDGMYGVNVTLVWSCPKCGGPRGFPFKGSSYDGSRVLDVDRWANPCGHIDMYEDVLKEANENGNK